MTLPTRRAILQLVAALPPGMIMGKEAGEPTLSAAQFLQSVKASHREAALAIGAWLARNGVNDSKLDRAHPSRRTPTRDIRVSFRDGPLIKVDGLLLPAGFCRFCLEVYRESKRGGELV